MQATLHPLTHRAFWNHRQQVFVQHVVMPVRTKDPGLVVLFLTKKSHLSLAAPLPPSYSSPLGTKALLSVLPASCGALGETGADAFHGGCLAQHRPQGLNLESIFKRLCQQHVPATAVNSKRQKDKQHNVRFGNARTTLIRKKNKKQSKVEKTDWLVR